ncbi:chitinase-3-like protein 1 [Hylaeus anthracinus]|uniref:chitinase-3-like protein 1 n=1 Tax=Hylaeus anthracinus TaxID=313031 RepID=UPI0023B9DDD1|nr:chitinase-3-like protein 1 [Hylaeus anthracinus]
MFQAAFLAVIVAIAATGVQADKRIVCYFGSWAVYSPGLGNFQISDINPHLCTHMIYSFTGTNTNGDVLVSDPWADLPDDGGMNGYGKFTELRRSSPGTKAMISSGGWDEGSYKYSQIVSNPSTRARFVQNVVNFLKRFNFDGFDLDWEYPNQRGGQPSDKENYVALLRELREEFDKYGYILSVAVAAGEDSASQSYLVWQVSQYVHFINLMTYDFNGSWSNYAGLNAPMYASSGSQDPLNNVNAAVLYWLQHGAPGDKINLGIPAYGRSFTLADPNNNGVGAPTTGPGAAGPYTEGAGLLGYNEICENLNQGGWTVIRDPQQRVPYAFKSNQWVGYDDPISVAEKANYINSMLLGGAMVWSIDTDDFRGTCGSRYPLLTALNNVLRGGASAFESASPAPTKLTRKLPRSVSSSKSICESEGYVANPQNCKTFYYCQKIYGTLYRQFTFICPEELVFDKSKNMCNYKYMVEAC